MSSLKIKDRFLKEISDYYYEYHNSYSVPYRYTFDKIILIRAG